MRKSRIVLALPFTTHCKSARTENSTKNLSQNDHGIKQVKTTHKADSQNTVLSEFYLRLINILTKELQIEINVIFPSNIFYSHFYRLDTNCKFISNQQASLDGFVT